MWQIYALMAQDIAREHEREAQAVRQARLAAEMAAAERRHHPASVAPVRPGPARRAAAGSLRAIETAAATVARSACHAASRLEGRIA